VYSVVLDTNVLVSGSIVQEGNPAFILDSWRKEKIQVITSLNILNEFRGVMMEKFDAPKDDVEMLIAFLIWKGNVVEPVQKLDVVKEDPDDNKFLEAALEGKADYIVSGDKDLLRLKIFDGIKIISPAEMVSIIKEGHD